MKLHEAIRLGATLGKQLFGSYYGTSEDKDSCALGAAGLALGNLDNIQRYFKELIDSEGDCPVTNCPGDIRYAPDEVAYGRYRNLGDRIVHLNDTHRWTRERIADWVQEVEDDFNRRQGRGKGESASVSDSTTEVDTELATNAVG